MNLSSCTAMRHQFAIYLEEIKTAVFLSNVPVPKQKA